MHKASDLCSHQCNFDGFSNCRASRLHESAAMYYLATVSGAQSCLGLIEEHPITVRYWPSLHGFRGRPDGAAASQRLWACQGNLPNSDVPVELKLLAAMPDHFPPSVRELCLPGSSHEATRPWLQLACLVHLLGCAGLQSALLVWEAVALAAPIGPEGLCSRCLCPVQARKQVSHARAQAAKVGYFPLMDISCDSQAAGTVTDLDRAIYSPLC